MQLDLTDEETFALLNLLTEAIEDRPLPAVATHSAAATDPGEVRADGAGTTAAGEKLSPNLGLRVLPPTPEERDPRRQPRARSVSAILSKKLAGLIDEGERFNDTGGDGSGADGFEMAVLVAAKDVGPAARQPSKKIGGGIASHQLRGVSPVFSPASGVDVVGDFLFALGGVLAQFAHQRMILALIGGDQLDQALAVGARPGRSRPPGEADPRRLT
jgi:hypothetical protein